MSCAFHAARHDLSSDLRENAELLPKTVVGSLMSNFRLLVSLAACAFAAVSVSTFAAESISGAGSSAAAPVYKIWGSEYAKAKGTSLDYAPIGSGAGMARINKHEVDFGASDVIASAADLKKNDLVMFPTVITGVVPIVNVAKVGANQMHLTGDVLGRIFAGQSKWLATPYFAFHAGLVRDR
jgi:phosphate transport system substrate-binding protein